MKGIPYGWVDPYLFLGCLIRPRYWSQVPWRFVSLFNRELGRRMRDRWRKTA